MFNKPLKKLLEHKIQSLRSIPEFFQIFFRLLPGKKSTRLFEPSVQMVHLNLSVQTED